MLRAALFWVLWLPFLMMMGYLFVLCLAAYRRSELQNDRPAHPAPMDGVVIIVAAHNEEQTLARCLTSLLNEPGIRPDNVYVVANHCTDRTVDVARQFDVHVIEHAVPGKVARGYGLSHGLAVIQQDRDPEIVVILDGDTWLKFGAVTTLVDTTRRTARPTQAQFLHLAQETASPARYLSEFAIFIRNDMRPTGSHNLGLPTMLFAGLMAFPIASISPELLADDAINEDMHLAIQLAQRDVAPVFCYQAEVYSDLYSDDVLAHTHRLRWEVGHIGLIRYYGLSLIREALQKRNSHLLKLAIDLVIPPLTITIVIMTILSIVTIGMFLAWKQSVVMWPGMLSWGLMFGVMALAWFRYEPKRNIFLLIVNLIPYTMHKIPDYLSALPHVKWRFDSDE